MSFLDLLCIYFWAAFLISNVKFMVLIWDFSSFQIYACTAVKLPLSTDLASVYKFLVKQGGKVEKSFGFACERPGLFLSSVTP